MTRPYSIYRVYDHGDGTASVDWETDDDDDCGYPNHIYSSATYEFKSLEKALAFTGRTRVGIGQDVTVYLDGEIYKGEVISADKN